MATKRQISISMTPEEWENEMKEMEKIGNPYFYLYEKPGVAITKQLAALTLPKETKITVGEDKKAARIVCFTQVGGGNVPESIRKDFPSGIAYRLKVIPL